MRTIKSKTWTRFPPRHLPRRPPTAPTSHRISRITIIVSRVIRVSFSDFGRALFSSYGVLICLTSVRFGCYEGSESELELFTKTPHDSLLLESCGVFSSFHESLISSRSRNYIFSKISIAFCNLSNTFSFPMISMLSNNGGLTFCPVTATRRMPKT
jgi:hypothetical protein